MCRRVVKGKVLKMDRPDGRRVLKFDGLSGRGLWYRPSGDEFYNAAFGGPPPPLRGPPPPDERWEASLKVVVSFPPHKMG